VASSKANGTLGGAARPCSFEPNTRCAHAAAPIFCAHSHEIGHDTKWAVDENGYVQFATTSIGAFVGETDSVFPRALGLIQRLVGLDDEISSGRVRVGYRHPDADGNRHPRQLRVV
jgi:hypothetical protein